LQKWGLTQKDTKLILPISQLEAGIGGGKSQGLAFLQRVGVNIPETFVITDNNNEAIIDFVSTLDFQKQYAIRSSAGDEDGEDNSFAGQFDSFLYVLGEEKIISAIEKCFDSASSETVQSYRKNFTGNNDAQMNVVVQEMIDPVISGVLFSVDPVSQRHDKISLSVVKGVGENLMSGLDSGESVTFFKHLDVFPKLDLIQKKQIQELRDTALYIEERYQKPLDLEWAIDEQGKIWWLQLRPITRLNEVHLNELDEKNIKESPIYTRGNIGEMMPGPVTPLTLSVFGKAIDIGLQIFYKKSGALKKIKKDEFVFIHSFYNHLFFDVRSLYFISEHSFFAKKENVDYSVVGEIVPGVEVKRKDGFFKGAWHTLGMIRYANSASSALKKLTKLRTSFKLECPDDIAGCHKLIGKNIQKLFDAYTLHYVTSSQSGSFYTLLLNIYSKGKAPERKHQEKVAAFFTNIHGIEGADVLDKIDSIAKKLTNEKNIKDKFLEVSMKKSILFLERLASSEIKTEWQDFLKRHGHRCVREAEFREIEWAENPAPVIEALKAKTKIFSNGDINSKSEIKPSLEYNFDDLSALSKMVVKNIIPKARNAVVSREKSKAMAIEIQYRFKKAYRHLAKLLYEKDFLDDEDQLFFLSHEEIGNLISEGKELYWKNKAENRRQLFPDMNKLFFADLSFGIPVPEEPSFLHTDEDLIGIPVSVGITEGVVRIVKSLEDASDLQKGEIMVANYTDVGWSPFFSIISGLITEIGSPLSHGAVVAREYGIPAVVSVKGAMNNLTTGQRIRLNGKTGEIVIL